MRVDKRAQDRAEKKVTNQTEKAEIVDFGSIKRMVAPRGWRYVKQESRGGIPDRKFESFKPEQDLDVEISAFYSGRPSDRKGADLLSRLLGGEVPYTLTPEEIKTLTMALGFTTLGDNQYSNSSPKGDRNYPVFNLTKAEVVKLNGRTVLQVTGNFQNDQATPVSEHDGYLFQARNDATIVEQIFFGAPTRGKYMKYHPEFQQVLKSVEWN